MPMSRDDDENDVYRVETVPPPPGEDDAYSAPTKVGAMPVSTLEAMKKAALSGGHLKPMMLPNQGPKPAPLEVPESGSGITRIRNDEDDEPGISGDATRVVGAAAAVVEAPREPVAVANEPAEAPAPVLAAAGGVPVLTAPARQDQHAKPVVVIAPRGGRGWPLLAMVFVVVALAAMLALGLYLDR